MLFAKAQNTPDDFRLSKNLAFAKGRKVSISKVSSLDEKLIETSGLIYFDNLLYSNNDSKDLSLHKLDTLGRLLNSIKLPLQKNIDWEEIQLFEDHIYLGDIGNNLTGSRKDLSIYKMVFSDLETDNVLVDTIQFSYDRQEISEDKKNSNRTNFDAEAFIVMHDFIYIFTKEWKSKKSSIYKIPNQKGRHIGQFQSEFNVKGLITGATLLRKHNTLILCGYSRYLKPFIYVFNQFEGDDFFGGNSKKYKINLPFHQIEAITFDGNNKIYLTNEYFKRQFIRKRTASLFKIDLGTIFEM